VDQLQSAVQRAPTGSRTQNFSTCLISVPRRYGFYVRQLIGGRAARPSKRSSQDPDRFQAAPAVDGCYRCIFLPAALDRLAHEVTRAMAALQAILKRWGDLQPASAASRRCDQHPRESELELRFIDKLRGGQGAPEGVSRCGSRHDLDSHGSQRASSQLSAGNQRGLSWKLEQHAPLPQRRWILLRADFLLILHAAVSRYAIYTDGWEVHLRRLASRCRQRMALQRSGRSWFWGLSWADVVENSQRPRTAGAQAGPRSSPPSLQTGALSALVASPLLHSFKLRTAFPSTAPARPRRPSTLQLLMA